LARPPRLTPEDARSRRHGPDHSLDLVGLRIGEATPLLSKWERGLVPPGKVWDRVERKLATYVDRHERLAIARVPSPPKQAVSGGGA